MIATDRYPEIGLAQALERLSPVTPWGRAKKRALRPFRPEEQTELATEFDRIEAAAALREPERIVAALQPFREILGTVDDLERRTLTEVELFELKRFVLAAERLMDATASKTLPAGAALPELASALAVLDPDGTRDGAFSVAAGSARLLTLRRQKRLPGADVAHLSALEAREELAVRREMTRALLPEAATLRAACAAIGVLDMSLAKARFSTALGGCRPVFGGAQIALHGARNPAFAGESGFVPLSFAFSPGTTVLTGSNMGGKSVALKTILLNLLLAHMGLSPLADAVETPVLADFFWIAGSLESAKSGLSDFGGQVRALNEALPHADAPVLLLIDELARGTNPEEGAAIAAAVVRRLNRASAFSVVSTHYTGVAAHGNAHYRANGLTADGQRMDYGFQRVSGDMIPPRDALAICRMLALDANVVADAERILASEL